MRECLAAAQSLMTSNYNPMPVSSPGNEESEKAQLQRIILDGSARRFQAHKIYLRIAAAKRWAMNRSIILCGQRPTDQHSAQLKAVSNTFQQVGFGQQQLASWGQLGWNLIRFLIFGRNSLRSRISMSCLTFGQLIYGPDTG